MTHENSTVSIRHAALPDGPALFTLAHSFATSFDVEPLTFERTLAELLTFSEACLAVAEQEGQIVGYVLGFMHPAFFANGNVAWVEELMVEAAFRQQGIGRKLMGAFETWARQREVKIVALATRRAAEFYKGIGYEKSAEYFRKRL